jgi:hypothetical protein
MPSAIVAVMSMTMTGVTMALGVRVSVMGMAWPTMMHVAVAAMTVAAVTMTSMTMAAVTSAAMLCEGLRWQH